MRNEIQKKKGDISSKRQLQALHKFKNLKERKEKETVFILKMDFQCSSERKYIKSQYNLPLPIHFIQ